MNNADNSAFPTDPSHTRGMTKRELIAMHALQGLLANGQLFDWLSARGHNADQSSAQIAEGAVRSADALLAELSKAVPQ